MQGVQINNIPTESVSGRFQKYVQIDTQSDADSHTFPSTEKQKNLARLLVGELLELGISDAHMDDYGYVYGTVKTNSTKKNIPVICFCSHMDTSPDAPGKQVKPLVHKNYQGQDIVLPDNDSIVIRLQEHNNLEKQIGNDIITASGNTLLGADDKAGIAEIMTAVEILQSNPQIKHGEIKILFTPDEEIGRGVDHVDIQKLGATYAYTMDGEDAGTIEDETFSANAATVRIQGISAHPGFAKGKMQNALRIVAEIIENLPKDRLSPESTSGKQGFVHATQIKGTAEEATIDFIIRDHQTDQLNRHQEELEQIVKDVTSRYPNTSYSLDILAQYRNMKEILDKYPEIMEVGEEGIRRAGMEPIRRSIRGGTDGSRLSFMGLPCPNIFAGGHAFHSKEEWVSVQDMQKAVLTIVHIANIWEERA